MFNSMEICAQIQYRGAYEQKLFQIIINNNY